MFMAQTGHCHPEYLDNFPQEPRPLSYTVLNAHLPITLQSSDLTENLINPSRLPEFFFNLYAAR